MNNNLTIFENLISPMSKSDFIFKYWDANFLYLERNNPEYYSDILTISSINSFLSRNDIRYPTIRMTKDGKPIPIENYTDTLSFGNYKAEGLINIDKLLNAYYDGATIVHQLMKYSINSISEFSNKIEQEFGFNVGTTVYLTPEKSQGFTAHYDTHSVFILQIYGTKTWRLYETVKDIPSLDQSYEKSKYKPTEPKHTIKLYPGDLLYVPRGMAHDAITTDGVSLHLTLGVFPHLWLDYFKLGLEKIKNNIDFRKSPIYYLLNEDIINNDFKVLTDVFLSNLNIDEISENLSNNVISRQMINNTNRLKNYFDIDTINLDTILRKRENIIYKTNNDNKTIYLKYYNKTLSFPIELKEAIEYVLTVDTFTPLQINGIKNEIDKIDLIKKLVLEGFLCL